MMTSSWRLSVGVRVGLYESMRLSPELVAQLSSGKKVCIWQHLVVRWNAERGLIIIKLRTQTLFVTLTEREREIALLVAKGRTYKQVAGDLCKGTCYGTQPDSKNL